MHELSIALSIVDGLAEESALRGLGAVRAVHLRVGALSGVAPEALLFAYGAASEGTPLAGSRLYITEQPVVLYCRTCAAERAPLSPRELQCPACGGSAVNLVHGMELEVTALEVSDEPAAAGGSAPPGDEAERPAGA